jgi:hypothetical protein
VDEGLHHLQGKTKRVKATELLELLHEFYRDKLTLVRRHEAAARHVGTYDFNNTYQYVIAREEMHVRWVRDAILEVAESSNVDGVEPQDVPRPELTPEGKGQSAENSVIAADRDSAQKFVDNWRPRVESMTHARHRTMLNVVLGETIEHKRFFEQGLAGRTDLLGRSVNGARTPGVVLPTRWVE